LSTDQRVARIAGSR